MSYKGSDLSPQFKTWFRKEKKRITEILESKGCTNVQLDYGFYYFSGFFTSSTRQIYYISCSDVRHFPDHKYMYRTAKHYKDWTGGSNQFINKNELENIKLL